MQVLQPPRLRDLLLTGDESLDATRFRAAAQEVKEVRVVVKGSNGEVRTPIWIVATESSVFVRSYRATQGKWYLQVLSAKTFALEIEGEDVMVRAEPVTEPGTLEKVSAAYRAKYPVEPETADMLSPAVVATTLHLDLQ